MRDRKLMNRGWKFYFGEPAYLRTRAESSDQTYRGTRAANARGPARRSGRAGISRARRDRRFH